MSYRLEMSAEIYDWLAELRDSDPPAAVMAARALAALADGGDRLGPPLVTAVAAVRSRPGELPPALDQHYQDQLESMTLMRRRVAQAATLRKDLERQLAELEPAADPAGLRERLVAAIEEEERLTVASQREQMRVDAFRTRKEVEGGVYRGRGRAPDRTGSRRRRRAVRPDDPVGAAARLDEIIGQIEQELGLEAPAAGLMELRPGAPADSDIRILFGVEPPGTALLIAVLEGRDAVQDHYREAVLVASEMLRRRRPDPWTRPPRRQRTRSAMPSRSSGALSRPRGRTPCRPMTPPSYLGAVNRQSRQGRT